VIERPLLFFGSLLWGLFVILSRSCDIELLLDPRSISEQSKNGSCFSFTGDGINVIFTGSELPLNQLASFPGFVSTPVWGGLPPVSVFSNSAASSAETGSGEIDRSLASLRKGRNVDDLEGELGGLEGKNELKWVAVLDR
jgi:hypothetical protein